MQRNCGATFVLVLCAFYGLIVQGETDDFVKGKRYLACKNASIDYTYIDFQGDNAKLYNYIQYGQRFQKTVEPEQKSNQQNSAYPCPEDNGRFPTGQCDSYIECEDGIGEEKLCPDGLLFNAALGPRAFPCQYPIDVDCQGRSALQEPQSTHDCPHQYGYYKIGDEANCGQFKNCVAGRGFVFDCPEGLAFNEESYRCDWPDQVESCNAEEYLGFTCPEQAKSFFHQEFRFFRSSESCQTYFLCIEGRPRRYHCPDGEAFNELTNSCDDIENVTGCSPEYEAKFDKKTNKKNVVALA